MQSSTTLSVKWIAGASSRQSDAWGGRYQAPDAWVTAAGWMSSEVWRVAAAG